MMRFIRFLILNLAGLGLAGWMQTNLFDVDGVKTRLASSGLRMTSGRTVHK